jgi:hypothetical protein
VHLDPEVTLVTTAVETSIGAVANDLLLNSIERWAPAEAKSLTLPNPFFSWHQKRVHDSGSVTPAKKCKRSVNGIYRTAFGWLLPCVIAVLVVSATCAAEDVVSAVHGTITKVDSTTKTIVVKMADGTEHSMHVVDKTTVHDANAVAVSAEDSWHALKEGTEVVVHYTREGTEDTAVEIDKIGKAGLKSSVGMIEDIDRTGKKLVIASSDGVKSTYRLTDNAAKDGGSDVGKGAEKGTRITIYYTEAAGKKVAHFFEKV